MDLIVTYIRDWVVNVVNFRSNQDHFNEFTIAASSIDRSIVNKLLLLLLQERHDENVFKQYVKKVYI